MTSNRLLHITWLFLLAFTTIGYMTGVATHGSEQPTTAVIPLLAAAAKFALVAWVFMELRAVSRLWAFGVSVLLAGILAMIFLLHFGLF
ncbi:MAG: cytochrome C oxidase subunit IV family protein [Chthoniobacterales bacterium]